MVEPQLQADTNPWSPRAHDLVDSTSPLHLDDNNSSYDKGADKALVSTQVGGQGQEHGLAPATPISGTEKLGLGMDLALNLSTSTLNEPLDGSMGNKKECKLQLVLQQVSHGKELIDQHLARTGDFLERDVLEHQVQRLQTQVAETRAIVAELETRLNLAEWSNRHIVEELKMLLADAEGTLVGSDESGSENETTSTHGHMQDEDANVIYNRICVVLQSLILDAQKALQRTSISVASSCQCSTCDEISHRHLLPQPIHHSSLNLSASFDSRRFLDRPVMCNQHYSVRPSLYSSNSEYTRILWQQKQQEQHERYRKSCNRINQELDIGLVDARTISMGSESDSSFYGSIPLSSPSSSSPPSSASSTQPSSPISYRPGVLRAPLKSSIKGRLSSDSDASVEPRRKKNQVQFVDSDEVPKRRPSRSPRRVQRRYKSQAVGSNSSTNIIMQLYGLWKQTWLRTRIMHVLTGSVEVMVVVFVLIRSVKASLSWVGLQSWAEVDWFSWLYGQRDSGASAKELYEKIKRDGLQWRRVPMRQIKESEAPEATSLLSPARIVYGPAKKALKDVAAGAALAYVSDNVWRLIKKF
ncbi:MAG: hypothetical protein BYD32DRAFT_423295 [Podila humilis]|nr:MAG: hypothetical protein BYD32DRAFT_423295 [Podila humilis]